MGCEEKRKRKRKTQQKESVKTNHREIISLLWELYVLGIRFERALRESEFNASYGMRTNR